MNRYSMAIFMGVFAANQASGAMYTVVDSGTFTESRNFILQLDIEAERASAGSDEYSFTRNLKFYGYDSTPETPGAIRVLEFVHFSLSSRAGYRVWAECSDGYPNPCSSTASNTMFYEANVLIDGADLNLEDTSRYRAVTASDGSVFGAHGVKSQTGTDYISGATTVRSDLYSNPDNIDLDALTVLDFTDLYEDGFWSTFTQTNLLTLSCGSGDSCNANSTNNNKPWEGTLSVTYKYADLQAVPLPAAAWLFGSALLGLVLVPRRKVPRQ